MVAPLRPPVFVGEELEHQSDELMTGELQRLPDPHGMISNIKRRLSKECAVYRSPYCEHIIAMRMQNIPFRAIEDWLIEQGPQHRISSATLWRNLKNTKINVKLTHAEEVAEQWGGEVYLDLQHELSQQILTQKGRIDDLVRTEKERQKENPKYIDRRISREMVALKDMVKTLHGISKSPLDATKDAIKAEGERKAAAGVSLSEDAEAVIVQLIVNGDLKIGGTDGNTP